MKTPERNNGIEQGKSLTELTIHVDCHVNAGIDVGFDESLNISATREMEVRDILTGMVAIGENQWHAMITMLESGVATKDDFRELDDLDEGDVSYYCSLNTRIEKKIELAKFIGERDGELANYCVNGWLAGDKLKYDETLDLSLCDWLLTVPSVAEYRFVDINVSGCTSLEYLPKGLKIGGTLNLSGCTSLVSLPKGMLVSCFTHMEGCTAWDGKMPSSLANCGGRIFTDKYPDGIAYGDWEKAGNPVF